MMYSVRSLACLVLLAGVVGCREAAPAPPERFSGSVKEELAAGRYTYFRLRLPSEDERWIVVADRTRRGAEHVAVESCRPQRDFASRRLKRTFSLLYFCTPSKAQS